MGWGPGKSKLSTRVHLFFFFFFPCDVMRASAWSFCCRAFPTTMDRTFTREPDKTFPLNLHLSGIYHSSRKRS